MCVYSVYIIFDVSWFVDLLYGKRYNLIISENLDVAMKGSWDYIRRRATLQRIGLSRVRRNKPFAILYYYTIKSMGELNKTEIKLFIIIVLWSKSKTKTSLLHCGRLAYLNRYAGNNLSYTVLRHRGSYFSWKFDFLSLDVITETRQGLVHFRMALLR